MYIGFGFYPRLKNELGFEPTRVGFSDFGLPDTPLVLCKRKRNASLQFDPTKVPPVPTCKNSVGCFSCSYLYPLAMTLKYIFSSRFIQFLINHHWVRINDHLPSIRTLRTFSFRDLFSVSSTSVQFGTTSQKKYRHKQLQTIWGIMEALLAHGAGGYSVITERIIDFLDNSSIRNARLVCKAWRNTIQCQKKWWAILLKGLTKKKIIFTLHQFDQSLLLFPIDFSTSVV